MRPAVVAAFLIAVFPLIATPGASLTLLIREVSTNGRHRALPVIVGTVTGLYVHASLAVAGLSALVMHSSQAFEIVRLAGAVYLVGLGVHCWRSASAVPETTTQSPDTPGGTSLGTYRQAVLANVLNPKAASMFLTLVPQFPTAAPRSPRSVFQHYGPPRAGLGACQADLEAGERGGADRARPAQRRRLTPPGRPPVG